jgi:hypothetical protein
LIIIYKYYDNRLENLRIVTVQENTRNRTKQCSNISGFAGVKKRQSRWIVYAYICDNNNKQISKSFTINNNDRNYEQCKQLAINQRNIWKEQLSYLSEFFLQN